MKRGDLQVKEVNITGYHDIAIHALDALHQRAKYELMADVMLVRSFTVQHKHSALYCR